MKLVLSFLLIFLSFPSVSGVTEGVQFLSSQVQTDGRITSQVSLSTSFQSTAESLSTLQALNEADQNTFTSGLQFLSQETYQNTENIARLIIAKAEQGSIDTTLIEQLKTHQNADGGFGELPEFNSTPLDTAFALLAMQVGNISVSDESVLGLGYLLNYQGGDGGWSASKNAAGESSVFITAIILKALSYYRGDYNIESVIDQGKNYLLAQQNANALWDEPFLSSLSIIALVHITNDPAITSESINALKGLQQSDGSWDQDVYTTALALRTLNVTETPPVNPILASIKGRFIDGVTGLPLEGVSVSINGPTPDSITTLSSGTFHFTDLTAGQYTLQSVLNGYNQVTAETMTLAGKTVDFGDIKLLPEIVNPTTATILGMISDSETGLSLEGVDVTMSGSDSDHVLTDIDGAYQFTNVVIGNIILNASKTGYSSAAGNTTLTAGGVLLFSPKLTLAEMAVTAVKGTILEESTGLPLKDVLISLSGSTVAQTHTDALGNYQVSGILPGMINIEASLDSFDSVSAQTDIHENSIVTFSPQLYSTNTTPIGSNLSGIEGIVVDAVTNQPLSNVLVTLAFALETQEMTTSVDGTFNFDGIDSASVELNFIKQGYVTPRFSVPLVPLESVSIGQVRIREETIVELLPDLKVDSIDLAQTTSDLNRLELQGFISVSISNQGTATAAITELFAFHDANNDGVYDLNNDVPLGSSAMANELAITEEQNVVINIQGLLPYRDAPVSVWVDSSQSQIESNELNNVLSTASSCMLEALPVGQLDPVEKWNWSGSNLLSSYTQVMSTPMVAQLTDDNGDGNIDISDTPDIIFTTFSGGRYTGVGILRAISGDDGTDIWNVAPQSTAMTSPAIGDIDNDGFVEIVVGGPYLNGLRVYEHDGTLKWQVSVSGSAHPSIADLDNDGTPEIIYGHRIYNAQGGLLRTLPLGDFTSIAVDLDMDGDLEIIANGIAYQHDGTTLWDSGYRGTFSAVGKFDKDDFPEIAIRTSNSVTLLNHDGALIWGPVAIPGGGGGPLTISDVDGDGEPEIGVAGAQNYTVIETDGSIKWISPTRDRSSRATGSSVFDFESDGKAEILYNDELNFRVYDGETGNILFQIRNTSGTLWEFPVVADIDNDGHAEIVLASNNYAFGGKTGIRVFENRDDSWVATRSIYNQHTYHINNVNDDGTIPQYEKPSWLEHNTYRLNTFLDRDPLSSSDLTVSLLRYIEHDDGLSQDLTARVGNAGLAPVSSVINIDFYEGDPASEGQLLGSTQITALAVNTFQDTILTGVRLSGEKNIYVVVDPEGRIPECNEFNNSMNISVPEATLGQITVSTDLPVYGSNQNVLVQATVINNSPFIGDFTANIQIEDAMGTVVETFPEQSINLLANGTQIDLSQTWNTGSYLAGVYIVRGQLYGTDGQLQNESTAIFNISHSADQNDLAVTLRTTTDKPIYHSTAEVQIEDLIQNITVNTLVDEAQLNLKVLNPSGQLIMDENITLGQLLPTSLRDLISPLTLNNAEIGEYNVLSVVLDAQTNEILASSHAQFVVRPDIVQLLTGTVTATHKSLDVGEDQLCTDQLINQGGVSLGSLAIRKIVSRLDIPGEIMSIQSTIALNSEATYSQERSFNTDSFEAGDYACVIQAYIETSQQWVTFDYDFFRVNEPPIKIEGNLGVGDRGRVLVLIDDAPKQCDGFNHIGVEATMTTPLVVGATVTGILFDQTGAVLDQGTGVLDDRLVDLGTGTSGVNLILEDIALTHVAMTFNSQVALGQGYRLVISVVNNDVTESFDSGMIATDCSNILSTGDLYGDLRLTNVVRLPAANDPLGPNHTPDLGTQRTVLESVLTAGGWSYTITTNEEDFTQKMHSGGYIAYLLLSEQIKLNETVQKELREAVYRGEGLIEAGGHDLRQGRLDEALGIKSQGKHSSMQALLMSDNTWVSLGQTDFQLNDRTLKTTVQGASVLGTFVSQGQSTIEAAITRFTYGQGQSLYFGFDLTAEMALQNADQKFEIMLLDALNEVHPVASKAQVNGVYPLRLTLQNLGIATPGQAIMTLPDNISIIDAGVAAMNGQTLIWPFTLAESEQLMFDVWFILPEQPVLLSALIQSGTEPNWIDQAAFTLDVTPEPRVSVDDVYQQTMLLTDKVYKQTQKYVQWAQTDSQAGRWEDALSSLIRASDTLMSLNTPESNALRSLIAQAIRTVSMNLTPSQI